jgi:hypothetical protein
LEQYSFHEGAVPPEYQYDFEQSLFNQEAHLLLQAFEGWHSYYILNETKKKISAVIHFHITGSVARSPLKSPFGSAEFSSTLPEGTLFEFIKYFERRLLALGVQTIIIKNAPDAYEYDHATLLKTFYLNLKYCIIHESVSSVIEVSAVAPEKLFYRSEKRRLGKARKAGLMFREIKIEDLTIVYNFIKDCRSKKNYELSMTWKEVQSVANQFPERITLFGVFKEYELVAASISIHVNQNVLYDFYHDHDAAFNHLSPVVLLVAGIYNVCYLNKIRLLDLGTSVTGGLPNFSLLHFKKYLGAIPTPKFTFEKRFLE